MQFTRLDYYIAAGYSHEQIFETNNKNVTAQIFKILKRKVKSWFPAVLLHIHKKKQPFSQFQQPGQMKTRCTITQTIIEGKFERGESVRFPIDLFNPWNNSIKMPSITWTGKCNKCYYIWTGQEKCPRCNGLTGDSVWVSLENAVLLYKRGNIFRNCTL